MQVKWTPAYFLAALALVAAVVEHASAACQDGTVPCWRGRCKGVRECVGGRWLGCEVPEECLIPLILPTRDWIVVTNAPANEPVGLFYDGALRGTSFNDRGATTSSSPSGRAMQHVGNLSGGAFGNRVIAFARARSPATVLQSWTPASESATVNLGAAVGFGVSFWIVRDDFANLAVRAAQAVVDANAIYDRERTGLQITDLRITDVHGVPNAATLLAGPAPGRPAYAIIAGETAGEINVYLIDTVAGAANRGANWDGTPSIILGRDAVSGSLLAHEIGHAFVLAHVGAPNFDGTNLMFPVVPAAPFVTEGQTYRTHFHPSSMVNAMLMAHPGQALFVCPEQAATDDCPGAERRVWADGTFPPN